MSHSRHDLKPLLITAVVASSGVVLLLMAVVNGWLGPDVGRGANFCEAARDGLVKQPANTYSNAGFVVAGLLIAWHLRRTAPDAVMHRGMATSYAGIVVLLGPASAAMHATQSAWGGHLDMLSMYLIAAFAAAYGLARVLDRGMGTFVVGFALAISGCELAGWLWTGEVPVVHFAGNLAFAVLLLCAAGFELVLWRRGLTRRRFGYGILALGSLLLAFVIWVLGQHGWCAPQSLLQAHALWHLLCAVAAYFLFRLYASERAN